MLDERPTTLEMTEPLGSVLTSVLDDGTALEAEATAELTDAWTELEAAAALLTAADEAAAADDAAAEDEATAADDSAAADELATEEDEGATTALDDEGVTGVVEDDSTTGADDSGVTGVVEETAGVDEGVVGTETEADERADMVGMNSDRRQNGG